MQFSWVPTLRIVSSKGIKMKVSGTQERYSGYKKEESLRETYFNRLKTERTSQ